MKRHRLALPGTFYATLESSSGGWNCNNDAHGRGTNDIWGCTELGLHS